MDNHGKILQVVGPVVDVEFEEGKLPRLYSALVVTNTGLVIEVLQHLGNNAARCVAMSATDGLVRGMEVQDTHEPIRVP